MRRQRIGQSTLPHERATPTAAGRLEKRTPLFPLHPDEHLKNIALVELKRAFDARAFPSSATADATLGTAGLDEVAPRRWNDVRLNEASAMKHERSIAHFRKWIG